MSDVKWIKITTDIFDDEKVLLIESLPESDAIIIIWFKLLCLAGKMNNSGVFMMNRIPITVPMLASIFRRKEATVRLALETFEQFGMIETIDNVITIPNWGKHQTLDQLERKKEYMRDYMREYRAKQKEKIALPEGKKKKEKNSKSSRKTNVSRLDKDKEKEVINNNIPIDSNISNYKTEEIISPEPKKFDSGPAVAFLPLNTGEEYPISQADYTEWQKLYKAVDVMQELNKMRGWCIANPEKRKTKRGIKRFINTWLSKQQDKGGTPGFKYNPSSPGKKERKKKVYKQVLNEYGEEITVEVDADE